MPLGLEKISVKYDVAILIEFPLIDIQPQTKLPQNAIDEILSIKNLVGWKVTWSDLRREYCIAPPCTVDYYECAERIAIGLEEIGLRVFRKCLDKRKECQSFILV